MNTPLVSVIIPLYNAALYLGEAIESIKKQTYTNIELLIINDGSTDDSLAIAKQNESERIKVFNQPNKGASAARNYGLREAKGEYIQFLDADDYLSTNKIEEQVKCLIEFPDNLSVCKTLYFYDGESQMIAQSDEWYFNNFDDPQDFLIRLYGGYQDLPGTMIQPNAWLTPKILIEKAGFWNEEFRINPDDDGEFFCRVILNSKGIRYADAGLNYYRKFKKSNSLSSQNNRKGLIARLKMAQLKAGYLLNMSDNVILKRAVSRNFAEIALMCYPRYFSLYKLAYGESQKLYPYQLNCYTYTPTYKLVTKIFGWKVSAWLAFLKKELKKFS